MKESILVIGSNGQIGTELVADLRTIYGPQNVVATDIKEPGYEMLNAGPFEISNVLDKQNLQAIFEKYKPTQIYLLAALLSATGEQKPKMAWELNMDGLINVLDLGIAYGTITFSNSNSSFLSSRICASNSFIFSSKHAIRIYI
jgi:nucleoside-diphosphate-sugar epimerase